MKSIVRSLVLFSSLLAAGTVNAAPIYVIATVKLNAGTQDAFKTAASEMVNGTRSEAGNVSYLLVQSASEPTEFATIELWRSQADIDLHMKAPHMQKFFQVVSPMFAPGFPVLKTYEVQVK